MVAAQWLVGVLALASVVAAEGVRFEELLKRQAPGTPAFNCHDNCGECMHSVPVQPLVTAPGS